MEGDLFSVSPYVEVEASTAEAGEESSDDHRLIAWGWGVA